MINILIADDSAFVRLIIEKILSREPDFNVIGSCANGEEVLEKLKTLKPDVITLDIEMPKMNGLETLEVIMSTNPIPVIIVSSLTTEGAEETIKALELGAVEVVTKPGKNSSMKMADIFEELSEKIKVASKVKFFQNNIIPNTSNNRLRFISEKIKYNTEKSYKNINYNGSNSFKPELVVIGVSTGGPAALQKIIPELPKDIDCSFIIAQHMPLGFTKALANRLNQICEIEVKEAEEGDSIKPGRVLICPSGFQTEIKKRYLGYNIHISNNDEMIYKPSIDVLFTSAAETYKHKTLGIIMTGMGNDGTKGCIQINKYGGKVFAQSAESCVVDSMPSSAIKEGVVDKVFNLDVITKSITDLFYI